jgi:ferrous iron transport protein B
MTFNFEAAGDIAPKSGPTGQARPALEAEAGHARRRALLVGQPNVGKSVVFGALTGTYVTVSNYPGTTVEITRGRAHLVDPREPREQLWEIVDTPGTHNLVAMTEDEAVTRDILLSEPQDALVQVGDAKNLARTLLLALQIAELGVPFCLDLNMLDEANARGLSIDLRALERELEGVAVNASTATQGIGLDGVRAYLAAHGAAPSTPSRAAPARAPLACAPRFPADVEAAIADVEGAIPVDLPVARRGVATMLLGGERGIAGALADRVGPEALRIARERAQGLARAHGVPVFALLSRLRLARAQAIVRVVQRRDLQGTRAADRRGAALSAALGRASTHPVWGLPILALVLLLAYEVVGVFGAGTAVDFIEHRVFGEHLNVWAKAGFEHLGIPWLTAFFVGPYGMLTMGVTYAVAIVLPVVATFFFVFSMLEDSGYLPRLAVMANRMLRSMGLNGKAVLPMVLGLGCDTMATLTARIMETRKERTVVTLLLALAIPCSSQLSVIFALMQRTSFVATLVWLAVMAATLFGVGWTAARLLPGDESDFLLEMPPIRRPMLGNILAKTLGRIEWYLKEAVPLFLAGTALLFVLDAAHLLVWVHRAGEPIVHHALGFPRSGGVSDRVSEALLVGFLRRDFGAAGLLDLARAGALSPADVAVSMVTITLFIPCIANVFMIAKERGWKAAGAMSAFIFPYAIAVGAVVRLGFRLLGGAS